MIQKKVLQVTIQLSKDVERQTFYEGYFHQQWTPLYAPCGGWTVPSRSWNLTSSWHPTFWKKQQEDLLIQGLVMGCHAEHVPGKQLKWLSLGMYIWTFLQLLKTTVLLMQPALLHVHFQRLLSWSSERTVLYNQLAKRCPKTGVFYLDAPFRFTLFFFPPNHFISPFYLKAIVKALFLFYENKHVLLTWSVQWFCAPPPPP